MHAARLNPAGAVINSAALNMTFLNWQIGITSTVQVSSSTAAEQQRCAVGQQQQQHRHCAREQQQRQSWRLMHASVRIDFWQ
jgi:hypothetical protein